MAMNSHQSTLKRIVLGALSGIFGASYRTRTCGQSVMSR